MPLKSGISVAVTRNHHWGSRWFAEVMKCRGQNGFGPISIGLPVEIAPYAKSAPAKPKGDLGRCLRSPAVTSLH